MAGDDLYDPLGLKQGRPRRRFPLGSILLAVLALALLSPWGLLHFVGDSRGGEPLAVAAIAPPKPPAANAPSVAAAAAQQVAAASLGSGQTTVEDAADLEQKSGVKVVRSGGGGVPGAAIIEVPQDLDVALTPAPDQRLVEESRFGPLPRIGLDGARPADVYARPLMTSAAKANAPRIALVVGGLGLSATATQAAIADLPGVVTLAFAPYGKDLAARVAEARAQGHEVMLQLPMEPIDYPQTNPGPHTLLASASVAENIGLHRQVKRYALDHAGNDEVVAAGAPARLEAQAAAHLVEGFDGSFVVRVKTALDHDVPVAKIVLARISDIFRVLVGRGGAGERLELHIEGIERRAEHLPEKRLVLPQNGDRFRINSVELA